MMLDAGSKPGTGRATEAAASGGTSDPAQRPRPASGQPRAIMLGIGLGAVASQLRSRRFHERAIIVGIGLAALAGLAAENRARMFVRLAAWDNRQRLRSQRKGSVRSA